MKILKFGGTSVGKPERMHEVAQLIDDNTRKIVVLSAVSGTTNKLVSLSKTLYEQDFEAAQLQLQQLRSEYDDFIEQLLPYEAIDQGKAILSERFEVLNQQFIKGFSSVQEKIILAQGELISTHLFQTYLQTKGVKSTLLPALDFMKINEDEDPDLAFTASKLPTLLRQFPETTYFITQGYICRNAVGEIDNLKRGGSDYTATLIGAALKADEIQIWTDIDGLHNNDPRAVQNTFPVRQLSYREAAELAYFGAKILHPTCVVPAEKNNVPILLKNTFQPEARGTLISQATSGENFTAIAAKDGIIAIRIRSGRMMNAYGFLRKVFEVFETYKTPIDMITTSEVAVSLTIDNPTHLDSILNDLKTFGEVSYDTNQTIICIVGDALYEKTGIAKQIFLALQGVSIRMVSYGGSANNISVLIHERDKITALQCLNEYLFRVAERVS